MGALNQPPDAPDGGGLDDTEVPGGPADDTAPKEFETAVVEATAGGVSGTALGARALRLSGMQGVSLTLTQFLQVGAMLVIAVFLGATDLGTYSLLIFLAVLISQPLIIAVRPGTIRRTFGAAGDDDEGDEDAGEETASVSPMLTLGTGLMLAAGLAVAMALITAALSTPISNLLLGDQAAPELAIWAGILGAGLMVSRLASLALWFEHRSTAFVVAEVSRPLVGIVLLGVFMWLDFGVTGAIAAAAIGAVVASLLSLILLWGSFRIAFDRREAKEILLIGRERAPVLLSFWAIQSTDIFFVSRFVGAADIGVYSLGSRLGGAAALLPSGLRLALRPLRKTALFPAARDQYGKAVFEGLILAYFVLLTISTILLMVLAAPLIIDLAPAEFADAAPLIPLSAAAMAMPVLLRTLFGSLRWPGKSYRSLAVAAVSVAVGFVALNLLLGPELGIFAPPVAALVSFSVAFTVLLVRGQRSKRRIDLHYKALLKALAIAAVIGTAYTVWIPENLAFETVGIVLAMAVYVAALIVFGAIPTEHRGALRSIFRGGVSGRSTDFDPTLGLMALNQRERKLLQRAVSRPVSLRLLAETRAIKDSSGQRAELPRGIHMVRCLRRAGRGGGLDIPDSSRHDEVLARFLFGNEPVAARQNAMRAILDDGEPAADVHALEDVKRRLAKLPTGAWGA